VKNQQFRFTLPPFADVLDKALLHWRQGAEGRS
jgi:hypothetical protein